MVHDNESASYKEQAHLHDLARPILDANSGAKEGTLSRSHKTHTKQVTHQYGTHWITLRISLSGNINNDDTHSLSVRGTQPIQIRCGYCPSSVISSPTDSQRRCRFAVPHVSWLEHWRFVVATQSEIFISPQTMPWIAFTLKLVLFKNAKMELLPFHKLLKIHLLWIES